MSPVRKPDAIGPRVVVRVHRREDPARLQRAAAILRDIIDRANALDTPSTPGEGPRR